MLKRTFCFFVLLCAVDGNLNAHGIDPHATIEILTHKEAGTVAYLLENPYIPGVPSPRQNKRISETADSSGRIKFSFEPNPYYWYRVEIAGTPVMYGCFSNGDSIVVSTVSGKWNLRVDYDRIGAYTEENRYYTNYGGKIFSRASLGNLTCQSISSYRDSMRLIGAAIISDCERLSNRYPEHVNFVRDLQRWKGIFELYTESQIAKNVEQRGFPNCEAYRLSWLDTVNPHFINDKSLNPQDLAEIVGNIVEARLSRAKRIDTALSVSNEALLSRFKIASNFRGYTRDLGYLYVVAMGYSEPPQVIQPLLLVMLDTMYKYKFGGDPLARQTIENYIELLRQRAHGADAYDFMLPDSSYKLRTLSDFRGKAVLLHFWGTWCGPCLGEIAKIKAFQEKHANDSNFVSINIALENHQFQKWKKFIVERNLTGLQLYAEGLWDSDVSEKFGVILVPFDILIDPKGKIVETFSGTNVAESDIEKNIVQAERN